jgi:hypothetical protein
MGSPNVHCWTTAVISDLTKVTLRLVVTRVLVRCLIYRDSARERHSIVVYYVVNTSISDIFEVAIGYA